MALPNIQKFSFAEATSNTTGKTSMPLVCGFMVIFIGCFGFATCGFCMLVFSVAKHPIPGDLGSLITQSVIVIGMGLSLLGIRRFTPDKPLLTEPEPVVSSVTETNVSSTTISTEAPPKV